MLEADSQVCWPVSQGTFCFCVYVNIDERSHIQRVPRVFTGKTTSFVPTTAHGVKSPHVSRVHAFSPFSAKSTEVEDKFARVGFPSGFASVQTYPRAGLSKRFCLFFVSASSSVVDVASLSFSLPIPLHSLRMQVFSDFT